MKKINQKQKNIMRAAGIFLFCVALILILNLLFNNNGKIAKKYTGTWMIGYNFYEGETEDNLLYSFIQELHLLKDGTFYTKDITTPKNANDSSVSGNYEVSNDKLIFTYKQNNEDKSYILTYNDDKLCSDSKCNKYYTKDKVEKYFIMHNASIRTEENKTVE